MARGHLRVYLRDLDFGTVRTPGTHLSMRILAMSAP